jgi:basic membrane protein A and related proteins
VSKKGKRMQRGQKARRIVALALLALVAAFVAGCGSSDNKSSSTSSGSSSSTSSSSASSANKNIKVAVLSTGATNNRSWANSWAIGVAKAQKELGVQTTMVGNVETPDQYVAQGSSFAAKGYNLIIFAHGAMDAPAVKLAKRFPKVQFVQAPFEFVSNADKAKEPPNLGHVDFKQEDGTFLAGALAAMVSKTKKLGAVYAFPFPALTRQVEGFALGAKCVDPNVQVVQKSTNSFTDAALARAAASSLYNDGADVVIGAVDQAVQGIIAAANAAGGGKYAIPSYFDDASLGPKVVLTSVLYNLDGVAYNIIKAYTDKQITHNWYKEYNLANGNIGSLAPNQGVSSIVTPDIQKKVDALKQKVISGDIKIPDAVTGSPTIGKVNSGSKIDPKSIGC